MKVLNLRKLLAVLVDEEGGDKPYLLSIGERAEWASISTNGRLTLNKELLDLPKPLGEYVMVHELVHLLAPNHGKVFKSFLFAYMPDWEERESQLRKYEVSVYRSP